MSSIESKHVTSSHLKLSTGSGDNKLGLAGEAFVLLERVDEKMANPDSQIGTERKKQLVTRGRSGARPETSRMSGRVDTLRDVKKDMSDKWSEMVSLMTKYEGYLREMDGGKGKNTENDAVRLRVENEEMKIKIKVIESKWKSFKDEAIKNEVKLQRRIKQLESGTQRLKEALEKMKAGIKPQSTAPKRKRELDELPSDEEEDEDEDMETENEKFGNVRVVSDPKRLRFHQDAIINGKRQRKPKFSHLKGDYAIDMKGMDKKLLDADDDVAGVGGEDAGEGSGGDDDEDEENWCTECNKNFVNAKGLRRHLKDMHGVLNPDAKFSCDQCNILLPSAVAYNRHMKYLHGQDEKPFTCEICHVAFATEQNLQSHIDNKVHEKKGIAKPKEDVKRVTAAMKDVDGKETTVMVSVVKASPKASSLSKPPHKRNICPLCFMVFPTSTAMNDHMKKHKQTKGGATYPCEHCDEIFYKKTSLVEHEARCPKNKSYDDKLWETIVFPEASQVLEEQANYKDESLIDPELGPTADLQEAVAPAGTITLDEANQEPGSTHTAEGLVMDTAADSSQQEQQQQEQQEQQQQQPQYETVSIVDESGQPLGQAQVSVDPVTGAVTYVALGQNGEPLPLSQALEGNDTSELLLSIINQANAKGN